MKPIFKTIIWSAFFVLVVLSVNGCAKAQIEPTREKVIPEIDPCDTCATYRVQFDIQNPNHTFNVFVDNVPVSGDFQACRDQSIRLSVVQDCAANGGQCSQWEIKTIRNGVILHHVTGSGSYLSHSYTIP